MLKSVFVLLVLISSTAFAFEECLEVQEDEKRLKCYDHAAPNYLVKKALDKAIQVPKTAKGPPLTQGEIDTFRDQVRSCWDQKKSEGITVTVLISFSDNGFANENRIGLLSWENVSDEQSLEKAFHEVRRTIIECNEYGYDLPPLKYEHWRDIEVTFDPKR